ncbi:hypothetical protein GE21DRAFT_2397 [Neurospora crassa]|uniref:Uncharacterized protein n=1 Tax=Neurospora crassa (strain ATCC 24698 / 74-OR23-1A / CBS 708.71 / DSM 1257 / FGSC 987) TaxID=367110 RepID=Q7SHK3_NEUCR|nr:hypothetical protein NCU02901 [Neurospora crassa OR74A]EAA36347.3 hypothetical protein NCU02901 [Neurospora crassa OR74A]KHE89328.1 hypothetical protein GE21DRAFT_2397 [Neurospora crassa]|eukprot:XP_965583.3 hypothetical protein NCU02901 [Neurospora crassa OR74A]
MSSSTLPPPPPPSTSQPLTLAAAASFLAEKARSTSQLIEKTLLLPLSSSKPFTDPSNPYPSNPSLARLANLSAKLLQFNQHANTLGDCLTSAANASGGGGVADELARTLDKALTRCDQGVEVISGQVKWLGRDDVGTHVLQLQPGTGKGKTQKEEVDGQVMEEYADLLIAHARLFIFGSQIVILDINEQAEWMAKADVDKMINKAEESAKKVLLGKSIFRQL